MTDRYPDRGAAWAATILRLSLGILFAAHAGLKLFVVTPAGTYAFFEKLGLPGMLGYAMIGAEFAIAAALILGLATRWASLGGIPILLGAIVTVHAAKGFWAGTNGWEFPALWTVALLVQAALGDGALALGRAVPTRHNTHVRA